MTEPGGEDRSTTGMPRWVKVFLIVAILAAVAVVVALVAGVEHGPGLHGP
ncbi:MAG: hypothetical protein WD770_10190 [Actinomycetota bacterium]